MPLSWNEIRNNSIRFAHEYADVSSEAGEKQSFWNAFFEVFGLRRRLVATFEEPVRRMTGDYSHIDLLWPGMVIVEHKSRGQDLGKAQSQAFRYIHELLEAGRHDEAPRYVIVSDFARIALHDLEPEAQLPMPLMGPIKTIEFSLEDFHRHIHDFAFIPGYKQHRFDDPDPINIKAAGILADLHDSLKLGGYSGHELERFLVRILFCLFADRTGIWQTGTFKLYIENHTRPDGADLGPQLAQLFEVLNTPEDRRQTNLDEDLATLPFVNGGLFEERLGFASFDRDMRNALLACTRFDWSSISPAIFGSLFQDVMEPRERRQIGGHYTNERDILKVIRALFLDELREELSRIKGNRRLLQKFHTKISSLRFLDPACGCGNFLVITYRELRQLEIEVLKQLYDGKTLNVSQLDVDAFYGIEISEWPARIAEVAMWLMDHQMNLKLSEAFGEYYVRLPLRKSPTIVCGNALRLDWNGILPPSRCSYVLGNPPFVGKHLMNAQQRQDMEVVWGANNGSGILDYVTAWYRKAAQYIQGTSIAVGFVSTNSISQGEQAGALWTSLFDRFKLKILFAHRTFEWESEARGRAHVHVVIIGFAAFDAPNKRVYEYHNGESVVTIASNVSPYLVEGPDLSVVSRSKPLCEVPACQYGNKPADGGYLIVEESDREELLAANPGVEKYLRPLLCAEEYLYSIPRWCLWLVDASPADIRKMPGVRKRIEAVREFRLASPKEPTRRKADEPAVFAEIRQPTERYVVIPRHTSETRKYIPFGYFDPQMILHDSCSCVPSASLYHFGVLSSAMHMAWVRQVAGRIKSDIRYSTRLVYNNYPWPQEPAASKASAVERAAQAVLDARARFLPPNGQATLADLYDPLAMPSTLVRAHAALDKAVDACYRRQPFTSERMRIEFLFGLYSAMTAPLLPSQRGRRRT